MIEKTRGQPLLERSRNIYIIQSDINMTMGTLFGHSLMLDCQDVQHLKH